jgi:hypothetical protein
MWDSAIDMDQALRVGPGYSCTGIFEGDRSFVTNAVSRRG